jgi:hypothetical protein
MLSQTRWTAWTSASPASASRTAMPSPSAWFWPDAANEMQFVGCPGGAAGRATPPALTLPTWSRLDAAVISSRRRSHEK